LAARPEEVDMSLRVLSVFDEQGSRNSYTR